MLVGFFVVHLLRRHPVLFHLQGISSSIFLHRKKKKECEILEGERDEEAEAEEAGAKKEEFPEINETCWAQEPQMLLAWQKFGVRIQSIGLDAGKGSLLFGTKHPKVVAIASPWDI